MAAIELPDVAWRIEHTPDWAACRGVFFNMLNDRAVELGASVANQYHHAHPITRFNPIRMYPLRDYIIRLADVARLGYGDVNRGMFEIQAGAFPSYRKSILGRAWYTVFGLDLEGILGQMCRTLPTVLNCGTAELIRRPNEVVVRFRAQYMPIDTALAGAVVGVARACQLELTPRIELQDPFNGDVALQR